MANQVKVCAFPGCSRPAEGGGTGGRARAYCSLPEHNRAAAFRARKDLAQAEETAQAVETRVVSSAQGRFRMVVEELAPLLAAHRTALSQRIELALDALDTIEDPSQLEAELAAAAAESARTVTAAQADAAAQAAAAQQAISQAKTAETETDRGRTTIATLTSERDALADELAATKATITTARAETEAALTRASAAETETARARAAQQATEDAAATASTRFERELDRAQARADTAIQRAETRADTAIQRAETRRDKLATELAALKSKN